MKSSLPPKLVGRVNKNAANSSSDLFLPVLQESLGVE